MVPTSVRITPYPVQFPNTRRVICKGSIRLSNINMMAQNPKYAEIKPEDAAALVKSNAALLVDVRYVCKVLSLMLIRVLLVH